MSDRKARKYAKQTRNAARLNAAATIHYNRKAMKAGNQEQWHAQIDRWNEASAAQHADAQQQQIPLGPGWFTDLVDPNFVRWHDGWGPTDVVHYMPVGTSHNTPPAPPPDHLVTGSHRPPGVVLQQQLLAPMASPAAIAPTPAAPDVASQLERLADLHRQGVLSDDEFAAAKQRLLT